MSRRKVQKRRCRTNDDASAEARSRRRAASFRQRRGRDGRPRRVVARVRRAVLRCGRARVHCSGHVDGPRRTSRPSPRRPVARADDRRAERRSALSLTSPSAPATARSSDDDVSRVGDVVIRGTAAADAARADAAVIRARRRSAAPFLAPAPRAAHADVARRRERAAFAAGATPAPPARLVAPHHRVGGARASRPSSPNAARQQLAACEARRRERPACAAPAEDGPARVPVSRPRRAAAQASTSRQQRDLAVAELVGAERRQCVLLGRALERTPKAPRANALGDGARRTRRSEARSHTIAPPHPRPRGSPTHATSPRSAPPVGVLSEGPRVARAPHQYRRLEHTHLHLQRTVAGAARRRRLDLRRGRERGGTSRTSSASNRAARRLARRRRGAEEGHTALRAAAARAPCGRLSSSTASAATRVLRSRHQFRVGATVGGRRSRTRRSFAAACFRRRCRRRARWNEHGGGVRDAARTPLKQFSVSVASRVS